MKLKKQCSAYILFFLMCLFSCQKENVNKWVNIQNEDLYIWTETNKQSFTYDWDGGSFDKLIHGNGVLYIYNNNNLISKETVKAYYGTISNNNVITLANGSTYIGKTQDDLFEGFGVYLKGQDYMSVLLVEAIQMDS